MKKISYATTAFVIGTGLMAWFASRSWVILAFGVLMLIALLTRNLSVKKFKMLWLGAVVCVVLVIAAIVVLAKEGVTKTAIAVVIAITCYVVSMAPWELRH